MPFHRAYSALCSRAACGRATVECMGSNRYALFSCTESSGGSQGRRASAVEIIDNINKRLFDELRASLKAGGRLNIAASCCYVMSFRGR